MPDKPDDIDVVAQIFATQVETTVRELGIKRDFNADQTGLAFTSALHAGFIYNTRHSQTQMLCCLLFIALVAVFFEYLSMRTLNAKGERPSESSVRGLRRTDSL